MTAQERLRRAIDEHRSRLRADIPPNREGAILALLRARDRLPHVPTSVPPDDLVVGRRLADPGGNEALRLCVESAESAGPAPSVEAQDGWAEGFLEHCGRLAEAELVLARAESGGMRLVDGDDGRFDAWIATKRVPASWRERADVGWWAAWLARRHEPEFAALRTERPDAASGEAERAAWYRRLADAHLGTMAYQLGYPLDAEIGGSTVATYRAVLARLIGRALRARDRGEAPEPWPEHDLAAAIAAELGAEPAAVGRAIAAFALDRGNAAYHAAVPGIGAPPLVRVGADRLVWSVRGLTTEPLLFLARELRRRDAEAYHNTAYLREGVFRGDLYALFADKRFVTSGDRIALRREGGDVRTDVDAVVFDRKTGALAVVELKSHDPFARSAAELARQRDNVLHANRQISGVLAWLQRHGADELLNRVDRRTAKTFRVRKVYPFVLGRYLVRFDDGPEADRRAAWGTWPQLLRLLDGGPVRATDANPLASLFARLGNDVPLAPPPADLPPREIPLGDARLVLHPSYAAFKAAVGDDRSPSPV